jgi:hypothetical protein
VIRASIARSIETLLTAAVLLIALTGNAQAYVRTRPNGGVAPARWTRPEVLLALDERELPPDLSANEVRKVLREVAAEWSAPAVSCTAMQVRLQQGMQASSGAATVSFRAKHWCQDGVRGTGQCYDSGSAARTTLRFGTVLPDSHEIAIVGAEIDLNAVNFDWATRAAPRTDPRGRPYST